MRKLSLIGLLFVAPLAAEEDAFLKWMDAVAQRQLAEREAAVARIRTPAEARARQEQVRSRILSLLGGLPDYSGPLNARVTGTIRKSRYTIEKVIFESLPKIFVAANLYRPNEPGRYPGVLLPLGHWEQGKPAVQRIAANLAMKGFVVLAYDPIGQGERQQEYDWRLGRSIAGGSVEQHLLAGAQSILAGENFARYRIWDAKRALDYLVSRPDVAGDRIGCTGCSGGGTLTTYIAALDPRVQVAAPACYINSFRLLFAGPTGDSEQSFPNFLSSGLDIADYVELFAPKPFLINSTVGDYFPIAGTQHAWQEALDWYRIFGASEKIRWAAGPGGHGTPLEIREAIYEWMIRWLKDGRGNYREEAVEMLPDFELFASDKGQVSGRDIYEIIRENFERRKVPGSSEELLREVRRVAIIETLNAGTRQRLALRALSHLPGADFHTETLAIEAEPGLEITGTLLTPSRGLPKPVSVLLVAGLPDSAARLARDGYVVLNLMPRGVPAAIPPVYRFSGDWLTNVRAWLIGRNLAGMRALDIIRGVDVLAGRGYGEVRAAARGVPGVWLLLAAAVEPRITAIWVDKTPYSLRAALDQPLSRNLHDAVIPGFALHWDFEDLVRATASRRVIWSDPSDWMGAVAPHRAGALYRTFEEPDDRFFQMLLK